MSEIAPIDLRVRAGSRNWHRARMSGIGASEIAAVVGLSPYLSSRTLYHRKRGDLPEQIDNPRMEWGRRLERTILSRFRDDHPTLTTFRTGRLLRNGDPALSWQLATPDAIAFEDTSPVVVEIKTGASKDDWGDDGSDDVPLHYRCQVMQSMDVLRARVAFMPVLFNGREYRCYVVPFDEKEARILRVKGGEFWRDVVAGIPPEVDAHPSTSSAMRDLFGVEADELANVDRDVVVKLARAKALQSRVNAMVALHENALREQIGNASKAYCDGVVVATRSAWTQKPSTNPGGPRQRLNFKGLT